MLFNTKTYWVNHKQTFRHEIEGNYLWSPTKSKNGYRNEFYENMTRIQPGDVVFSFADAQIRAVGICVTGAIRAPKPEEFGAAGGSWDEDGWMVSVSFELLNTPIRPKEHMAVLGPTLPTTHSPIRITGDGNQGAYLALIPPKMGDVVIDLIGPQWHDVANKATDHAKDVVEKEIQNRTDIGETEKSQLVRARRGQGIYRRNLEGLENACRITGVLGRQHLRASHMKPWRLSNNFEKLDGNNGLLLSPHIDHLFDRGFLSFEDDGRLLVSEASELVVLERWHIDVNKSYEPFRPKQIPYLSFHRNLFGFSSR